MESKLRRVRNATVTMPCSSHINLLPIHTYSKHTVLEYNDIKVDSLEIILARVIMIEASKTYKHVVLEDFALFSRFLRLDVFCRQWVDTKDLQQRLSTTVFGFVEYFGWLPC